MKRQKVFNVVLRLGVIVLLLAQFGVEARTDLDSRDIAVSDQIVAAKEVTVVLYSVKIVSHKFSSTCTFKGEGDE